jgi:hypothetical protein
VVARTRERTVVGMEKVGELGIDDESVIDDELGDDDEFAVEDESGIDDELTCHEGVQRQGIEMQSE